MKRKILLVMAAALATAAHAYTVYDAGKAFNEAGHNTNSFGVWSLLHASGEGMGNTKAFDATTGSSGSFVGIGGSSSPWIRVNTGGKTTQSNEEVLPNELLIHPANPNNGKESYPSDVVRFTAPEAGWYSASIFAHDTSKEGSNVSTTNSGVQVSIRAQGKVLIRQIVSLENFTNNHPTCRFDFQMPVRYLAAGDKIEVVIGNKYNANNAHTSDSTGLRFTVTKEDEGRFYDSGIAMANCIANAATYENPYGTIEDGSWYFLKTTVPSADADLAALAPGNFSRLSSSRILTKGTVSGRDGFGDKKDETSIKSPYVVVNSGQTYASSTAPCELGAHPVGADNKQWTTIRFRPPVAGYYSASVVARHLGWGTDPQWDYTGVDVYLLASEHVVTNAYVFIKDFNSTTARLTFGARLFAAGEPVDIVISPHGDQHTDETAISAIFRREEGDVYDAGVSYYAEHASDRCSNYFADLLDENAKWLLAKKTDPWAEAHSALGAYLNPSGNKLTWWTHATDNSGTAPRFTMATNGIASVDSLYITTSLLLATIPYELITQTKSPSSSDRGCATLRAEVPSNGIYRVRSYARDLNNSSDAASDGVRVIVSAKGNTPVSAVVSRDNTGDTYPSEAVLSADRLWMKQGEGLYFTTDPRTNATSDATALTACYEKTGEATARVINVDITGSDGEGRFSAHVGAGREGWSDWNKWNAMRYSSSIDASKAAEYTIANCREADGTTKRNVAFTLKRDSGVNIAKGWSPTGYVQPVMLGIWAKSENASDTYTFTLSNLKVSEPYTLYLYSSKGTDTSGNAVDGNARFTVGGVTKTADETWNMRDAKVVARFDVMSDANGEITGTFVAGDADTSSLATSLQGGAFNGLTLVGDMPDYTPPGLMLILK